MLWQCEENDETWWSNKNIVKCVTMLLNRLKLSFFNRHLPHYFIREINLFHNVADELISYGQAVLESLCAYPIVCIEEVSDICVSEYALENNKSNKEISLKHKLNLLLSSAKLREKLGVDEYKDKCPNMQALISGEAMGFWRILFEEQIMPDFFPGVPTDSFNDLMETINPIFSNISDILSDWFKKNMD